MYFTVLSIATDTQQTFFVFGGGSEPIAKGDQASVQQQARPSYQPSI